ncbi:MAG: EthD family reductase [Dehalococcoidales bacterium]|nr:EthD family reductase [Dehalococcoidales bacterium]
MIKTIVLAHRKPGMTREEFNQHWLEVHAPLSAKYIPGLKKYVQNHFISIPGIEYEGDGIVETWYDSIKSWQEAVKAIRANKELMADGPKFLKPNTDRLWVLEEHVILDKTNE